MQAGALPEPSMGMVVAADTAGHPLRKRSRWRQLSLRRACRCSGTPGTAGSRQCCYPLFGGAQRREYALSVLAQERRRLCQSRDQQYRPGQLRAGRLYQREDAAKAYASYMGIDTSAPDAATYSNMEIGGGRMTGVEKTDAGSREFAFTVLTNMRRLPMAALRRSNPWTALPGISSTHRIRWRKRRMTLAMEKSPTTNPLSRSSRRHPSERTGCKWRSKAPALGKLSM